MINPQAMTFAVICHISNDRDVGMVINNMALNKPVQSKFSRSILVFNYTNELLRDKFMEQVTGYEIYPLFENKGYQFGFLDLCSSVHAKVDQPYLQLNGDIRLTENILNLDVDYTAELNYLPCFGNTAVDLEKIQRMCSERNIPDRTVADFGYVMPQGWFFISQPNLLDFLCKWMAIYNATANASTLSSHGQNQVICSEDHLKASFKTWHSLMSPVAISNFFDFIHRFSIGDGSCKGANFKELGIFHAHGQ